MVLVNGDIKLNKDFYSNQIDISKTNKKSKLA